MANHRIKISNIIYNQFYYYGESEWTAAANKSDPWTSKFKITKGVKINIYFRYKYRYCIFMSKDLTRYVNYDADVQITIQTAQ